LEVSFLALPQSDVAFRPVNMLVRVALIWPFVAKHLEVIVYFVGFFLYTLKIGVGKLGSHTPTVEASGSNQKIKNTNKI
jgi:hypothetical protein